MKQKKTKVTRHKDRAGAERKLLEAAKEAFAEHGFNGATTRMVADKSQVNLGLITRYFKNKTGLLLALIDHEGADTYFRRPSYPPQSTLMDECMRYAESELTIRFRHAALIRIITGQMLTDRDFATSVRDKYQYQALENLKLRLAPFFKSPKHKGAEQQDLESFARRLERCISATMLVQSFIGCESELACAAELQELIFLIVQDQQQKLKKD